MSDSLSRVTHEFRVTGMHCSACEFLVAEEVTHDPTVATARARRVDSRLWVELTSDDDPAACKARWNARLEPLGYRIWLEGEDPGRESRREWLMGLALGLAFLGAFSALQASGVIDLLAPDSLGFSGAFVLGLLASVSSCFALVGGLLLTFTAAVGRSRPAAVLPGLLAFHGARLAVFVAGGGLLGVVGAAIGTSMELQRVLLTVAALVMAVLGLSLLGLRLPGLGGSVTTVKRAQGIASWGSLGGGLALGASTFFLPCGFTQSVQFQALASGSFMEGASLTLAFALGTLPVLASLGWILTKGLSGPRRAIMLTGGGVVVLGLGLLQLWGASHLWGLAL